ncbi:hypothetical protein PR202_gb26842 [Eleusine coracana subsp. coracana]|uniref:Sm domain-containing protein n=1 Tax=Eleusine coracana subsp. coracana TaxID=191504 RepID=A0AAV5FSJ8_ELECO|nr:hypothetical protein PR202_gb26842 [Eleusine coracana subsp. coracana]
MFFHLRRSSRRRRTQPAELLLLCHRAPSRPRSTSSEPRRRGGRVGLAVVVRGEGEGVGGVLAAGAETVGELEVAGDVVVAGGELEVDGGGWGGSPPMGEIGKGKAGDGDGGGIGRGMERVTRPTTMKVATRQTGSAPAVGGGRELPLSLLKTAQGHPMLVELKNGETYNGHLVNCDTWMNIHLREDGDKFWRMPECYIRGNTIKYLRVPDEVIDKVQEETSKSRSGSHQVLAVEEEEVILVVNLEAEASDVAKMMGAKAVVDAEGVELVVKVATKVGAGAVAETDLHMGECRFLRPVAVLHRFLRT